MCFNQVKIALLVMSKLNCFWQAFYDPFSRFFAWLSESIFGLKSHFYMTTSGNGHFFTRKYGLNLIEGKECSNFLSILSLKSNKTQCNNLCPVHWRRHKFYCIDLLWALVTAFLNVIKRCINPLNNLFITQIMILTLIVRGFRM